MTCFTGKIEMGQGPMTSLPQMLAEELDVPLDQVDIVMGNTERCPWDMGTFGSMTTPYFGPALQKAAAEARAVLLELAADSLKLPVARLTAKDGAIFDTQNPDQRVTYSQLTRGKRIERRLEGKAILKAVADYKVIGRPVLRRDAVAKVTGAAQYTGDLRLTGQLYARLLHPPAHGAKLKTVNTEACRQIPGVQVVQEGDFVAVCTSSRMLPMPHSTRSKPSSTRPSPSSTKRPFTTTSPKSCLRPAWLPAAATLPKARSSPQKRFRQSTATATSPMPPSRPTPR